MHRTPGTANPRREKQDLNTDAVKQSETGQVIGERNGKGRCLHQDNDE
jgi:hypothetical protein